MTSVVKDHESEEYSDTSQDIEPNNSGNDVGPRESDYDSQGSDSENSNEDSEKAPEAEKRVDDDEDRSNPQYIPKRGTFYEHDDRTASGDELTAPSSEPVAEKKEGSEAGSERRRTPRGSHQANKWSHDKFNENEQAPKSREELVSIYGYDIRNEDAPPHARRNRKYGRGPNKYTRTWEDEEAYKRQTAAAAQHRKPPTAADFPQLPSIDRAAPAVGTLSASKPQRPRVQRPRSRSQPASNDSSENGENQRPQLRRNASTKTAKKPPQQKAARHNGPAAVKYTAKPPQDRVKELTMPAIENLTITTTVLNNSNVAASRKVQAQQRPVATELRRKPPAPLAEPPAQPHAPHQPHHPPQPPPGLEARGGSKRYSSLRQRPLAEPAPPAPAAAPPPLPAAAPHHPAPHHPQPPPPQQQPPPPQQQQQQQQQRYHAGDFPGGGNQPPPHPQQLLHQVVSHASPPQHAQLPQHAQQVRLGLMEQQQLVQHQHHAMHPMQQPHNLGQLQPAQGYAPPPIMPTQFMQQQGGSGAVFGAAAMFAPQAFPHQMYPHHNYSGAGGGGVYYAEEPPRRRPTSAIPIVRPTNERPPNPEKDNIDRIVENMFVRKPWPATQNNEAKDQKTPESRSSQEPQSKESSQPNSLTSSSISTDSKPAELKEEQQPKADLPTIDKEAETTEA